MLAINRSIYGLLAIVLIVAPGCASIFSSGPDLVPISSTPEGAKVKIDGLPVGKTPMTATVARESLGIVSIELEGYETATAQIHKSFNGISVLNLFFWPGWLIDAVTGDIQKHDRTPISIDMDRKTSGQPTGATAVPSETAAH